MLVEAVLLALAAGLAIPAGGLLAHYEHLSPGHLRDDMLHGIVAFGGGVLLAAVALVLVPEGVTAVPVGLSPAYVLVGAIVFLVLDRTIARAGGDGRGGQALAMVNDFVPESIGLGAAFATGDSTGPLLALLIGLQNLPEGFNAYRDATREWPRRRVLVTLAALSLLGPIAATIGFTLLQGHAHITGAVFLFASGGILYAVFQDIAPLAHKSGHWFPALGAVIGFVIGLLGQRLLG